MKRLVLVAVLAIFSLVGCGDDETAAVRTAPAKVTPVPTEDAPVPSPTAEIHASPTPTPTSTPDTGGAQAGDEEAIRVPVAVTLADGRISVDPDVVAAFLPLRLTVRNTLDRDLTVVVMLEQGESAARIDVPARAVQTRDLDGLREQSLEILSPDLGAPATATLKVRAGG